MRQPVFKLYLCMLISFRKKHNIRNCKFLIQTYRSAERNTRTLAKSPMHPFERIRHNDTRQAPLVIVADIFLFCMNKLRDFYKIAPKFTGALSLAQAFSKKNLAAHFFVITKGRFFLRNEHTKCNIINSCLILRCTHLIRLRVYKSHQTATLPTLTKNRERIPV